MYERDMKRLWGGSLLGAAKTASLACSTGSGRKERPRRRIPRTGGQKIEAKSQLLSACWGGGVLGSRRGRIPNWGYHPDRGGHGQLDGEGDRGPKRATTTFVLALMSHA